jgi:hypothetical protein
MSILYKDIVGNFLVADVITDGDGDITGMWFDAKYNRLWYHVSKTASELTYYIQMQENSDLPYANFPTTGTHSLITSRWDMGFYDITKAGARLRVEASNLDEGTYLKVYYSLDNGDWIEWNGTGNGSIKTNGVTTLDLSTLDPPTLEFEQIKFRVDFITDDSAQTPVLESFTLSFLMRPDTKLGWAYNVVNSPNMSHGLKTEARAPAEVLSDLLVLRDSKSPIRLRDHHNQNYWVYLTSIQERTLEDHMTMAGGGPTIEAVISINLVEVLDG